MGIAFSNAAAAFSGQQASHAAMNARDRGRYGSVKPGDW
jgi:hypothetical protein